MTVFQNFYKHIQQIKSGGILTIIKKLRSFIYLILQIPIYLISIPAVIIIHLIRPWFLIRWNILYSSRIGHFASNTELYCCERDAGINTPSQRYADFFYLRKYIANKQLEKMWRRNLIILPTWLLLPICRVNRFFCFFIPSCKEHEIRDNANSDRDVHNLIEKFTVHIGFTYEEKIKGREILKKFGLPDDAKFVCLLVRDSGYLDRNKKYESHERWSYHSYRDGDIDKYVLDYSKLNTTERVTEIGIYGVLQKIKEDEFKMPYQNNLMKDVYNISGFRRTYSKEPMGYTYTPSSTIILEETSLTLIIKALFKWFKTKIRRIVRIMIMKVK